MPEIVPSPCFLTMTTSAALLTMPYTGQPSPVPAPSLWWNERLADSVRVSPVRCRCPCHKIDPYVLAAGSISPAASWALRRDVGETPDGQVPPSGMCIAGIDHEIEDDLLDWPWSTSTG